MSIFRLPLLHTALALGLIAALLALSGCLWVRPGPRGHRVVAPILMVPAPRFDYHRHDRPSYKPRDRRWDDRRGYAYPRG